MHTPHSVPRMNKLRNPTWAERVAIVGVIRTACRILYGTPELKGLAGTIHVDALKIIKTNQSFV